MELDLTDLLDAYAKLYVQREALDEVNLDLIDENIELTRGLRELEQEYNKLEREYQEFRQAHNGSVVRSADHFPPKGVIYRTFYDGSPLTNLYPVGSGVVVEDDDYEREDLIGEP